MQPLEKQIAIRFSKEMYTGLENLAEEEGKSIADTVRTIIRDYFEFGSQKIKYEEKIAAITKEKDAAFKATCDTLEFNKWFLHELERLRNTPYDPRTHKIEELPDGRKIIYLKDQPTMKTSEDDRDSNTTNHRGKKATSG